MSCKFNSFEGECQLWDEETPDEMNGCKGDGYCVCEEDPDPSVMCEDYESDEE